jgi:branched-chain amino acid transport system ATP-binding protein
MSTETVLSVKGLCAGYGATPILQGIDLEITRGEIVSLIGRNGVGKTTVLRCLMGQLRVNAGTVDYLGRDITGLTPDARARLGIGYIPQGREVFPRLTVEENLAVGSLIGGPQGRKLTDMVYSYFPRLAERRKQAAGTMSGGEQQQLAIGRVLIGNPALLLLDEPSEGVQPSITQMVCDVLKSIRNELGSTILFVEQNLDTIMALAERCYVVDKGRIVSHIGSDKLANRDTVRDSLLI